MSKEFNLKEKRKELYDRAKSITTNEDEILLLDIIFLDLGSQDKEFLGELIKKFDLPSATEIIERVAGVDVMNRPLKERVEEFEKEGGRLSLSELLELAKREKNGNK